MTREEKSLKKKLQKQQLPQPHGMPERATIWLGY
jgi:hypothetical protein